MKLAPFIALIVLIGFSSCGKKKDKADILEVSVIHPSGQSEVLPHGVHVQVYANGELYLEGITNEANQEALGATSIQFTPQDRLSGEAERLEYIDYVLVSLGDSISNVGGEVISTDGDVYITTAFEDKETNEESIWVDTHYSYFGLLSNSTWKLTLAYLNGTEGTPVLCALDNTLTFTEWGIAQPSYSEETAVCANGNGNVSFNTPLNFAPGTINGSACKVNNASGNITIDSQTANLTKVSIIYPDTLVLTGNDGVNTVDYYFTKQ